MVYGRTKDPCFPTRDLVYIAHLAEAAFAENLDEVEVGRRVFVHVGRKLRYPWLIGVASVAQIGLFSRQHLRE